MLYWIPTLGCIITGTELKKALKIRKLDIGEYRIFNGNDDGNIPYMDFHPTYHGNSTIARSWLAGKITPESYGCRRKKLLDEIYRTEERFSLLDNQLNNLDRMLIHTIAYQGENDGNATVANIYSRAMEEILEKESSISLALRYLKDLYLAMHEEIKESLSMK